MTYQKKTGLGKGLSALLDDTEVIQSNSRVENPGNHILASSGGVNMVLISQIEVNPFQPRTEFDKSALHELSESIKLHGLIQPITLRKN